MKTGKTPLTTFILFLGLRSILCAEPSVNAKVSATEVTLNSALTLVIEISGIENVGGAPNINLPDFQVQRAGETSSYQWVNGQSSSLIAFNYLLSPLKTGTLQIPAITLNANGNNYSTQPIQITVKPEPTGSTGAPPSQPGELPSKAVQVPTEGLKAVFMTSSVDVSKTYVGQQILLKVQFLRRPDVRLMSQPRYIEPEMTGFLVEPLKQQEYVTTLNGNQYQVTELPYALFPTSDGEFTIGSAQIELAVRRQVDPFDPDGFFQNFFGRSEVARLSTRAIPIQVRALPKNKPIHFSGSVGRFKLNARVDTEAAEVGKPFNLILTVDGVGNVNAIKEPTLPELAGFRRYETISSSKISKDGKFLNGSKEFKILLIPQVSGPLTIPPINFVYFNPAENEYVTETTKEITFQVKPGNLAQSEPDFVPKLPSNTASGEGIRVVEKDIRFLKSGVVHSVRTPLYLRTWFLMASAFPPLFAFVAFVTRSQSERRRAQPLFYRSQKAYRKSSKILKKAHTNAEKADTTTFYGLIHSAMAEFLADKFGVSSSGLRWEEVEQRLTEKKIETPVIMELREIFDRSDMARFATSSFSDDDRASALEKAKTLLTSLNKLL